MSKDLFNFDFWQRRLRDLEDEIQVMHDEASWDGVFTKHDLSELKSAIIKIISFRNQLPIKAEKRAEWNKRDEQLNQE